MRRELVPGRAIVSGKRESVIVDRALFGRGMDGIPDFTQPVIAPLTDEHVWFTVSTTVLSMSFGNGKPYVNAIVLVARPEHLK